MNSDSTLHRNTFSDADIKSGSHVRDGVARAPRERPGALPPVSSKQIRRADLHVASALPFLLLGPLSKIGYLQTIDAALGAVNRADDMALFAAALAYKVLKAPSSACARTPGASASAAAFAGLDTLPPQTDLALAADAFVSPLNAVLARAVIRGRNPQRPMLLTVVETNQESGLLLTDIDGLFPAAWAADPDDLAGVLRQAETVLLLIDARSASPGLLASLDQRGLRFITDAPPSRGEKWRTVQRGPAHRWTTNDRHSSESLLGRTALELAGAAELVDRLWGELAVVRPVIGKADDLTLDHALTLAAAVALGQIAWTLWHEREATDPLLTIERFGDLDARVRFGDESVRITLPLGRRSLDLADHGLLADVSAVPWFGGRIVTFAKG